MRGDEYNFVPITNEKDGFSSFEFGGTQKDESTAYQDNKEKIKDEINEQKAANDENVSEERKEKKEQEDQLEKELNKAESSSESSEASSSSSSSSSSAASGSSAASATASGAVATVAAVVIAVPTVIALTNLTTAVLKHDFISTNSTITYNLDLNIDPNDDRLFGIYLSGPLLSYYDSKDLVQGKNEGTFFGLQASSVYEVTVVAYQRAAELPVIEEKYSPRYENSYYVEALPDGDVLLKETVYTNNVPGGKELEGIAIRGSDYVTDYCIYDKIDLTNLNVVALYNDGSEGEAIDKDSLTFTYDFSSTGEKEVTISYQGMTTSYNVNVHYHYDLVFTGDVDFKNGDTVISVTNVYSNLVYNPLLYIDDEFIYEFPSEVGDHEINLLMYEDLNLSGTHTIKFSYSLEGREDEIFTESVSMRFNDISEKISEIYRFTLSPTIDYGTDTTSSYHGTGKVLYTLDFIDELRIFDNLSFRISTTYTSPTGGDPVDCVYSYEISKANNGQNLIDLSYGTVIEGEPISDDVLIGNTFSVTLYYTESGESKTLDSGTVTFVKEQTTFASISPQGTYTQDSTYYYFPIDVLYEGFVDGQLGKSWLRFDGAFISERITAVNGETNTYRVPIEDVPAEYTSFENIQVEFFAYYYYGTVVMFNENVSFRGGQNVYPSGTYVENNSNLEDGTIRVHLDYSDSQGQFDNFELKVTSKFTYKEGTEEFNYHVYSLETQYGIQEISLNDGRDDGIILNFEDEQYYHYTYEISYLDTVANERKVAKSADIYFTQIEGKLGTYYDAINQVITLEVSNVGNLVNINDSSTYYEVTLTDVQDSDITYTWGSSDRLLPQEASQALYPLDVSDTGVDWNFTNSTYNFSFKANQPKGDGTYELVEYNSGETTFEMAPSVDYTTVGNLFRYGEQPSGGGDTVYSYYLPVNIDVLDPLGVVNNIRIAFNYADPNELDLNTPVDPDGYWAQGYDNVTFDFAIQEDGLYGAINGWRNIDISNLMNTVYTEDVPSTGEVTEGSTVKYSIYTSSNSGYYYLMTNSFEIDFTNSDDEVYGAAVLNGGYLSSDGSFAISIGQSNNGGTISSIAYVSLSVDSVTYYIPVYTNGIDTTFIQLSLVGAYSDNNNPEPVIANDPDLQNALSQADAEDVVSDIVGNHRQCSMRVYYVLNNDSALVSSVYESSFYFKG